MSVAVITTSINARPPQLAAWREQCDELIVAGDSNSPEALKTYVEDELDGRYMTLEDQERLSPELFETIPLRSIQRRNFALLEAIAKQHDYVMTVDDDNQPRKGLISTLTSQLETKAAGLVPSNGMWFDPGSVLRTDCGRVHARGLPYDIDRAATAFGIGNGSAGTFPLGVVQAMAIGDPDIDAVTRMAQAPDVYGTWDGLWAPAPGVWSPLNSQSTLYDVWTAPLAAVLPYVGRMDDIWGGYIAERILHAQGRLVAYSSTTVCQERNPHNLVKDLRDELLGYERTSELVDVLSQTLLLDADILEQYRVVIEELVNVSWFPFDTLKFMTVWADAVEAVRPE